MLRELERYNPFLMQKDKILAITKCDIIDKDTQIKIKKTLPKDINTIMISSVSGMGITELKDLIYSKLNM